MCADADLGQADSVSQQHAGLIGSIDKGKLSGGGQSTHDFCSVCDIETSLQCFQNITNENGILLGFPCLCPSIVAKILQRGLTLYTAPAAHPAHHSDKTPGVDTKPIEEI